LTGYDLGEREKLEDVQEDFIAQLGNMAERKGVVRSCSLGDMSLVAFPTG